LPGYLEYLKLPPRTTYTGSGGGEYNAIGEYENLNSDPLISFFEYAVGMEGMKKNPCVSVRSV
jgi:hypothetical protein